VTAFVGSVAGAVVALAGGSADPSDAGVLAGEAGASADQFNDGSLKLFGRLDVAADDGAPLVAGALGVEAPELAGADGVAVASSLIRPSRHVAAAREKKLGKKQKGHRPTTR
jgi:hypothetical protein